MTTKRPGQKIAGMEAGFFETVGRLFFALAVGGVLGLQREIEGKPAGMRTNMLMCMGSCLLMILSTEISRIANVSADPTRIAAQVMTGIGFLGAGAILKARLHVTGLTSAATIWFVAACGLAIGAGAYSLAASGMVLVLLTLSLMGKFEYLIGGKQRRHVIVFQFPTAAQRMKQAKRLFSTLRIYLEDISVQRQDGRTVVEVEYVAPETNHRRIVEAIGSIPEVEILVEY